MTTPWLTPDFVRKLEVLELAIRSVRAGHRLGGRFPINRRGASIEFSDYVPYSAGDDIRAIDWNLYARLDRLYVRTYKEEIALSVEIIVDATRSMGLPTREKFERAMRLAVCLGYIAVADRHHARFSWIKPGRLEASGWWSHRSDLVRMLEAGEGKEPGGQTELSAWARRAAAGLRMRGGQAILITDGMIRQADFFQSLHFLALRQLEPKVIQVLTPEELHPARVFRSGTLIDSETGHVRELAYGSAELERAVTEHNEALARFCKRHGVAFARHRLDEPLETFVTKTLPACGLLS